MISRNLEHGGGRGIAFSLDGDSPEEGFLLQEYVEGLPYSVSFVAHGPECVALGLIEQLIG